MRQDDENYLDGVYADQALTTQLNGGDSTSPSSEPGLMLTMLEALDVRPGHRVYECGTGTCWNAALLAHRLGDANVTTVDVDPGLTAAAVERLAAAGYHPVVHTGDGAAGLPERGPFDRVIATCRMQAIPWEWVAQSVEDAVMVVPIGWGLARVVVRDGQAQGRFLPGGAYFMPRRTLAVGPRFDSLDDSPVTTTTVPIDDLMDRLQFPLSLALPGCDTCTWPDEKDGIHAVGLWTPDGSTATADGTGHVRQLGPRRLWDTIEELHALFPTAPDRDEFGITVTAERLRIWWRSEDGPGWDLPQVVFA
ncbi:methyltransferase domain-containing protein [Streptomyces sp. ICBB 8177]|uniref:methyltransferase domain-containing protein n=1 Tax=Streptomyces sp. ICBB 8177 TaxID=563922 RepID=UPI0013051E48|nr:methyltransferase domain-containing protein [Streptomyces sp. ICBB 8177]